MRYNKGDPNERDEIMDFFDAEKMNEIAEENRYDLDCFLRFAARSGFMDCEFESGEDFEMAILDLCSAYRTAVR